MNTANPEQHDSMSTAQVNGLETGKVYFVSDVHLGDGSHADAFQGKDRYFLKFLDQVAQDASTLVILGDALDFEQAWYFSRIMRAHKEVITRLTRLADEIRVVYVFGNHDPDILLFKDILNWELCTQVVLDKHILAVHGYEFDPYVGENMDESNFWARTMMLYERIFKTWIRLPLRDNYTFSNRACHYAFLWIVRATRLSRWLGPKIGRPDLGAGWENWVHLWTRGVLGDPMGITRPALASLADHPIYDTVICGHSHLPGIVVNDAGKRYINLGSWSFGNSQYGIWDGTEFQLEDWITGRRIRDENYRPIFDGQTDRTFEQWFQNEYLGWLRFRCGEEALREGVRPRPFALSRLSNIPEQSLEIDTTSGEFIIPAKNQSNP
jgi:UDP-2,3-diacylglucosamine pyrophosphatase LpxH